MSRRPQALPPVGDERRRSGLRPLAKRAFQEKSPASHLRRRSIGRDHSGGPLEVCPEACWTKRLQQGLQSPRVSLAARSSTIGGAWARRADDPAVDTKRQTAGNHLKWKRLSPRFGTILQSAFPARNSTMGSLLFSIGIFSCAEASSLGGRVGARLSPRAFLEQIPAPHSSPTPL